MFVSRHQPVITNRISFEVPQLAPLPVITARMDFAGKWDSGAAQEERRLVSSVTPENISEGGDDSDHEIQSSSSRSNIRIPKPQGEPGRPRSGGYNLSKALKGWGEEFKTISKTFIKDEADKVLDTMQCYKNQPSEKVVGICELAAKRFPILDKYEDYWPARDILKAHIKYRNTKRGGKFKHKKL